ncbi:hypothetical protein EDB87DRAFT_1021540 [Lactarius vividus]|nr:hypothetical protein EDB87DRAFT_1021540 [Lactarius vividus]
MHLRFAVRHTVGTTFGGGLCMRLAGMSASGCHAGVRVNTSMCRNARRKRERPRGESKNSRTEGPMTVFLSDVVRQAGSNLNTTCGTEALIPCVRSCYVFPSNSCSKLAVHFFLAPNSPFSAFCWVIYSSTSGVPHLIRACRPSLARQKQVPYRCLKVFGLVSESGTVLC